MWSNPISEFSAGPRLGSQDWLLAEFGGGGSCHFQSSALLSWSLEHKGTTGGADAE
jgi:hypothetical protein